MFANPSISQDGGGLRSYSCSCSFTSVERKFGSILRPPITFAILFVRSKGCTPLRKIISVRPLFFSDHWNPIARILSQKALKWHFGKGEYVCLAQFFKHFMDAIATLHPAPLLTRVGIVGQRTHVRKRSHSPLQAGSHLSWSVTTCHVRQFRRPAAKEGEYALDQAPI